MQFANINYKPFLGAFEKLRKMTITLMSVYL